MDATFKTRFQGRLIECKTLTSGQLVVIQMLNLAKTEEEAQRGLSRLFRFIESRVGPEEWERIDDGMTMGTVEVSDLMALAEKITEATAKAAKAAEDASTA